LWSNVEPLVAEVLSGKPAVTENLPIMTTRGGFKEVAYFSTSYTPLFDDDGEVAGLLAIVAETSESIREQERIARERDRLQALFEEAPGFMAMTTGTEHRYVLANKAYRAMVGHEGLLGKAVFEVNPEFLGTGIPALLEQAYTSGEPFLGEEVPVSFLRVPDQPLEQRFVTFIYQPVKEAATDEVTGIFLEGFDVTKKRVSELGLGPIKGIPITART
jgi:PAS domain-containing protein